MVIRYPNGRQYEPPNNSPTPKKSIAKEKDFSYSNRGKSLEDDLNETNAFYLQRNLANIHKKPVPIQIVKVEYPSRSAAVIREAYFRTASTTDYNGVWNGHYIDFEAKETTNKTSFPLSNIHSHQIAHMKSVEVQKGIAFFIIRFTTLQRDFIVPFKVIETSWEQQEQGGRKSIPLTIFEQQAIEVKQRLQPRIDYLAAVGQFIADEFSL